jgi:predicted GIY-YIG superfamily endonuclease/3-methyladenine DNA glycosylase AlkD
MYYLYILECADESLYTGITTDLTRRIKEHNNSQKGAKYTVIRRPVKLVFSSMHKNRSLASKEEYFIKQLTRKKKMALIAKSSQKADSIADFRKDIQQLANPQKAQILAGFFKTGKGQYGHGDLFLGVTVPQIRLLTKKYANMTLNQIVVILGSKLHEERLFAVLMLVKLYKAGNTAQKKQIFQTYLANRKFINNWDLVDSSAQYIVGDYLANKPKKILQDLALSDSLWDRRIAIIATFHEIRLGQSQLTFTIAKILLGDKEDLIHKAMGWMLREVGKNCGQAKECEFLDQYLSQMSRTTLRYAIERFEEADRQNILKERFSLA